MFYINKVQYYILDMMFLLIQYHITCFMSLRDSILVPEVFLWHITELLIINTDDSIVKVPGDMVNK